MAAHICVIKLEYYVAARGQAAFESTTETKTRMKKCR